MVVTGALFAQCADVAIPEATPEALRYYRSGNILWVFELILSWFIPLLLLFTGWSGKLGTFAEKKGRWWFVSIALYLVLFIAIYQLMFFPFDYYTGYVRQHDYGLSTQTFGRWLANDLIGVGVLMVSCIAFVWIVYLLLKKSPRRWWFYSSVASMVISFIIMFVQPIWVDPLYNNFGPMKDKQLEEKILALASRAKIEHGKVYEVNKSQDTTTLNAYVTGFGSTNRIVLWDTTIQQMQEDEILFVMGHEMGHYVLHHVWWSWLYFGALFFFIFYLTYRSANYLMRRYSRRFKFSRLSQIASLPLLLFLTSVFMFLTQPLSNFVSRTMEHHADQFGLEITQNNTAAAEAFLVLQQKNLATPRPGKLFKFLRSTHPPLGERVDFCNSYCPWKEGRPLKYGEYFN
jgi:Zn-dependent protease with chaperone function